MTFVIIPLFGLSKQNCKHLHYSVIVFLTRCCLGIKQSLVYTFTGVFYNVITLPLLTHMFIFIYIVIKPTEAPTEPPAPPPPPTIPPAREGLYYAILLLTHIPPNALSEKLGHISLCLILHHMKFAFM